jgi:hypothetical protein
MYRFIPLLLVCLSLIFGCSVAGTLIPKQELSENYAVMEGVHATNPAMIDGNLRTVGTTVLPEGAEGAYGMSPTTEAIVTLPEKKVIYKIVIHAGNLKTFDVFGDKGNGDWVVLKEIKSVKSNPIQLSGFRRVFPTDRIRVRVLATTDDASLRRSARARGGFLNRFSGNRRAPAEIYEIEIYGYKSAEEVSVEEAEDQKEKELDELLELNY